MSVQTRWNGSRIGAGVNGGLQEVCPGRVTDFVFFMPLAHSAVYVAFVIVFS